MSGRRRFTWRDTTNHFFLLPFISSTRQRQSKGAKSCLISSFFCRRLMVKVFSRDSLDTVLLTMVDFTNFSSGVLTINGCEFTRQNTDKSHQFVAAATMAQRHFFCSVVWFHQCLNLILSTLVPE